MVDEPPNAVNNWSPEPIPDQNELYMRIHCNLIRDGNPIPGAFRDHGRGMSTDWNKYSTPTDTLNRAKEPKKNGVIRLRAGDVRAIPNQVVEHSPDPLTSNRAHTDVIGTKDEEVRLKYTRIYSWVVNPPS